MVIRARDFSNSQLAAQINGIHFNLIYRTKIILEEITSGHKIQLHKFAAYCLDIAKLCGSVSVESYASYNVHNSSTWCDGHTGRFCKFLRL